VIGGCSFEAKNQRYFYIDFTRLHLNFQLCIASVNLPNLPCVVLLCSSRNWSFEWKYWSLGDDLVHFHILHLFCFNLVGYDLYQCFL